MPYKKQGRKLFCKFYHERRQASMCRICVSKRREREFQALAFQNCWKFPTSLLTFILYKCKGVQIFTLNPNRIRGWWVWSQDRWGSTCVILTSKSSEIANVHVQEEWETYSGKENRASCSVTNATSACSQRKVNIIIEYYYKTRTLNPQRKVQRDMAQSTVIWSLFR
jgi:hypothetical protein